LFFRIRQFMKKLLLILIFIPLLLYSQTAIYPGAVVTDQQLKIAVNNVQTTLNAAMMSGDTGIVVVNATGFVANMLVSIDNEIVSICSVSGNILTVGTTTCPNAAGRGFDGTSAVGHVAAAKVSGFVEAWHSNAKNKEIEAIETALGANLANVGQLTAGVLPVNLGGTNASTQATALANILGASAVPIANGGTGATTQGAALTAILGSVPLSIANGGSGQATQGAALTALLGASTVPIANGGTGQTTQAGALSAILASSVVPIANGGTNASTQAAALSNILGSSTVPTTNGGTGQANLTSLPLVTPKVTVITDASGNPFVRSNATGSAVDSLTIVNAATANPATVRLQASGTDSNINLEVDPAGSGKVNLGSTNAQVDTSGNLTVVSCTGCGSATTAYVTSTYNFPAQSPAGTLTGGVVATVTLAPCPQGVGGSDANHYLYVAGTGTPEPVLISAGSCTYGAGSGTVQFTPANNHSGGWTIASATAGIQEAVNVAIANGSYRNIFTPAGTYTLYAGVNLNGNSNITWNGAGSGATFLNLTSTSSGTVAILASNGYTTSNATNTTADINGGTISNTNLARATSATNTFTLTSATGYAIGQLIYLVYADASANAFRFTQINRIKNLVGAVVTTENAVLIPLAAGQSSTVQTIVMASGLSVSGITFDGTNGTGTGSYAAIYIQGYRSSTYYDLIGQNLSSPNIGAFNTTVGYQNSYRRLRAYNSGDNSGGSAAAFYHWYETNSTWDDIISEKSSFGFEPLYGTNLRFSNIIANGGLSARGIKLNGLAYCEGNNIIADYNSNVGIFLGGGTYKCQLTNLSSSFNQGIQGGGNGYGLDFDGEQNVYNTVHGFNGIGNTGFDIVFGTSVGAYDHKNAVYGITRTSTFTDTQAPSDNIKSYNDTYDPGTAVASAVTLNSQRGIVTTEALTTAAGAAYTLTLTDSRIGANSLVMASVANGTNAAGIPVVGRITPGVGNATIEVRNVHASAAFNGTLVLSVLVQ
jgi:hypothetical protein